MRFKAWKGCGPPGADTGKGWGVQEMWIFFTRSVESWG